MSPSRTRRRGGPRVSLAVVVFGALVTVGGVIGCPGGTPSLRPGASSGVVMSSVTSASSSGHGGKGSGGMGGSVTADGGEVDGSGGASSSYSVTSGASSGSMSSSGAGGGLSCACVTLSTGVSPVAIGVGAAACPTGYVDGGTVGVFDGGAGPCSCSCDQPIGEQCDPVTVTFYANDSCGGGGCGGAMAATCIPPPNGPQCMMGAQSALIPTSVGTTDGGCTARPDGGGTCESVVMCTATSPPSAGTCDAGEVCFPRVSGFQYCVPLGSGVAVCPPGFTTQIRTYDDCTHAPGCTPCTCSPPKGGTCPASVVAYSDSDCATPAAPPQGGGCFAVAGTFLGPNPSSAQMPTPGECHPNGGMTTTGATPTVYCCLP